MGIFKTDIQVGGGKNGSFETVTVLVDTGAIYSMFPERLLRSLGVEPFDEREFTWRTGASVSWSWERSGCASGLMSVSA